MTRQLFKHDVLKVLAALATIVLFAMGAATPPAGQGQDNKLYAVVPRVVIYPGETVGTEQLRRVEVTNPNLAGNYTQSLDQVVGMVTRKTLLPDHAIYVEDLKEPAAVSRGSQVRLVYSTGNLQISALGLPLEDGSIGDLIRVRNSDSGLTVSGTVIARGIVQVVTK